MRKLISSLERPFHTGWTVLLLSAVFLLHSAPQFFAAEPAAPALTVRGEVENPQALTLADLQALPQITVQARDRDGTNASFSGVSLWEIVNRAKPRLGEKPAAGAAKTSVLVKATDNFQALFALAELDPEFTDHKIILAWQRNGQPLAPGQGPLRLIVPGEKSYARWVRQVAAIEVVQPPHSAGTAK